MCIRDRCYADDINIIGRSRRARRESFLAADETSNRIELHINQSETKYMMAGNAQRSVSHLLQNFVTAVTGRQLH